MTGHEHTQHGADPAAPTDERHGDGGGNGPPGSGINAMAASATLHCLTGCAIGEIAGLIIGTAIGLSNVATIALAIGLAFLFGYALSTLPLLKAGLSFFGALGIVLAADTLSIATMEVVDNAVMAAIPGAMDAGLSNPVFWLGMMVALTAAFFAAYPVNRFLLGRGKGHALTHHYMHGAQPTDWRRFIPSFGSGALAAVIVSFMLGGLVVAAASGLETGGHGAAAGDARTIEVGMTDDLRFDPEAITVARGETIHFVVRNAGDAVHEFLVGDEAAQAEFEEDMAGGGMDHETSSGVSVGPGQTEEFEYTFETEGVLLAGCHEPGHYDAGMVATITVGD